MLPVMILGLGCSVLSGSKYVDTGTQDQDSSDRTWVSLSLYLHYGCALDSEGYARCSGVPNYTSPSGTEPDEPLLEIAASFNTGCGLREDGTPVCFSHNDYDGIPLTSPPDVSLHGLAPGPVNICAIQEEDGHPICWGSHNVGIVGNEPDEPLSAIALSRSGACGITTDGGILCWGDVSGPLRDTPDGSFVSFDLGADAGVALDAAGSLVPWGDDEHGLWDVPEGTFTKVAVGAWIGGQHQGLGAYADSEHACAIDKDQELVCWGDERYGAVDVPDFGSGWTDVDANGLATCGIHSGQIYCWGTMQVEQALPRTP